VAFWLARGNGGPGTAHPGAPGWPGPAGRRLRPPFGRTGQPAALVVANPARRLSGLARPVTPGVRFVGRHPNPGHTRAGESASRIIRLREPCSPPIARTGTG